MNPVSTGMALGIVGAVMALPFLLIGFLLVRMGHWPRRQGSEPHCRKCEYLLKGIDSPRCPECGTVIDETTKVLGHRRRFIGLTLTGVAFVGLGLTALIPITVAGFHRIDWYKYSPTSWLIGWVETGSGRAWQEILRRDAKGELSSAQVNQIVRVALNAQALASPRPLTMPLLEFTAQSISNGLVDAAQQKIFFNQAAQITVQVPPVVFSGDKLPLSVVARGRNAVNWWTEFSNYSIKIDGRSMGDFSSAASSGPGFGSGNTMSPALTTPDAVGNHLIEVTVHIEIFNRRGGEILSREDRTVSAGFVVKRKIGIAGE